MCDSTNNHVIGAKFNEMKVMTMHYMIMGCFFVYVNKDIGIYPCCFAPTSVVLKGRGSIAEEGRDTTHVPESYFYYRDLSHYFRAFNMFLSPTYRTALWFFRRTHRWHKHLGK